MGGKGWGRLWLMEKILHFYRLLCVTIPLLVIYYRLFVVIIVDDIVLLIIINTNKPILFST